MAEYGYTDATCINFKSVLHMKLSTTTRSMAKTMAFFLEDVALPILLGRTPLIHSARLVM